MARTYIISEICGDWSLHIKGPGTSNNFLFFKSRNNAELVKSILEWEDAHPNKAVPYKPTLTPPNEPERAGLYGKYTVYKNKDGSLVTDCFILRPAKDPAAVAALRAYAATTDNAELAADIINWVGAESNEWVSVEERLPTDERPVLVFVGYADTMTGFITTSSYFVFDANPHWQWDGLVRDEQRTLFWMPLPAPPDRRPPEGEL